MKEIGEVARPERIRLPEVARRASDLILAVETASPEAPTSLDVLVDSGDIGEEMEGWLRTADRLHARHDELFSSSQETPDLNLETSYSRDFKSTITLSRQIIAEVKAQQQVIRAAVLGLATLQFAEAGACLANDSSLVVVDDDSNDIVRAIADRSGRLANDVFDSSLASCIRGDINKIPDPRTGYLGSLVDTHYGFWTAETWNDLKTIARISPEIFAKRQELISQFPVKSMMYDVHSWLGRPSPGRIREQYVHVMKAFQETLQNGESAGHDATINTHDAVPFIFEVLNAAIRRGYSPEGCLRLAVRDSAEIGRLTERTKAGWPIIGNEAIRYEGRADNPQLVIDFPEPISRRGIPEEVVKKLYTRDKHGSICPARHPVAIRRNGETQRKIKLLSGAVYDRIGVQPPIIQEVEECSYVDPAALMINYILLAVADNYYAL
jgi:hypothetical protein